MTQWMWIIHQNKATAIQILVKRIGVSKTLGSNRLKSLEVVDLFRDCFIMIGIRQFLEVSRLGHTSSVKIASHAKEFDCGKMLVDTHWRLCSVASAGCRCSTLLQPLWLSEKPATAVNQSGAGV